jgi:hypothetical protein
MAFLNSYDPATGTYSHGSNTGLTADQYRASQQAFKQGNLSTFDPSAVQDTGTSFVPVQEKYASGEQVQNPGFDLTLDTNGDGALSLDEKGGLMSDTAGQDSGSVGSGSVGSGSGTVGSGSTVSQPQTIIQQLDTSGLATSSGMNQGFNSVLGDTGQIKSDVTQGFADVGGQLTGLGTQIGNNQTALTGQIGDLSGNVTEGFANTSNALNTGFEGVNTNLNTQFDTQNQNLTDMSANILGGQTNLQDYLEGMSGRADTYYGGLSEGQSNIMGEVGGLQSGFSDFRKAYDDNTTMANQTRNQLIDQVTGGFRAQDQARAEYNTAAQKERADISATLNQQQQIPANAPASYVPALRDIAAGSAPTTTQASTQQADALNRITAVKNLIGMVGQNMDPALRSQYETLASSFDDNGVLIPVSQDGMGNITQRALDNQSNLLATTINTQNQVIDQRAVNVDQLLSYMDQLGYAGNQGTGQLTNSGLMGPTINTFG